jgi:hypothetical protein
MQKITTLFRKDDSGKLINEIGYNSEWVVKIRATKILGGLMCKIENYTLYIKNNFDQWVLCDRKDPNNRHYFEAFDCMQTLEPGFYELLGPLVNDNELGLNKHLLIQYGTTEIDLPDYNYKTIKEYLSNNDIHGIAFIHPDGRISTVLKSDFDYSGDYKTTDVTNAFPI